MKKLLMPLLLAGLSCTTCGQNPSANKKTTTQQTVTMDTSKLSNPAVKAAIAALQLGNKNDWFALFTDDATLYDDGNKMEFRSFFEKALGHERFTSIDKTENNGLDVYGRFHSDQWGDFKTYFKFQINAAGKISRLDIGQANY